MERYAVDTVNGVVLNVRVVPSSSRNLISEIAGDQLKVKVAAPPVDGEANAELIAFLGKCFKVPKRDVTILKGETGKAKKVLLAGLKAADVVAVIVGILKEKK